VPSGDDGVRTEEEGLGLIREARRRGTATLYATPHVTAWDPLTPERRARVVRHWRAMARVAARYGVEFELGWELGPHADLLALDPWSLRLGSLEACLVELPLPHIAHTDLTLTMQCIEHVASAGLTIIVAHPERCDLVHPRPEELDELLDRGCLLQVNATSLTGRHGDACERLAWRLIEEGRCSFVASDGHRESRPPFLDDAFRRVAAYAGEDEARRMFEGAALDAIPRAGHVSGLPGRRQDPTGRLPS